MSGPVDIGRWPVAVVVLDEDVDAAAARAVTAELDDLLRRREPMGFVFDYQRASPEAQQLVSQWLAERVDALRALVRGAVTVVAADRLEHVQSLIESGMFTMPFDSWATATVDDGVAWVSERLADG